MEDSNLEFFIALLGTAFGQIGLNLAIPLTVGGLIGLIIAKITRPNEGATASVLMGIIGAILGGTTLDFAGIGEQAAYGQVSSAVVIGSVAGATILTLAVNIFQYRAGHHA